MLRQSNSSLISRTSATHAHLCCIRPPPRTARREPLGCALQGCRMLWSCLHVASCPDAAHPPESSGARLRDCVTAHEGVRRVCECASMGVRTCTLAGERMPLWPYPFFAYPVCSVSPCVVGPGQDACLCEGGNGGGFRTGSDVLSNNSVWC